MLRLHRRALLHLQHGKAVVSRAADAQIAAAPPLMQTSCRSFRHWTQYDTQRASDSVAEWQSSAWNLAARLQKQFDASTGLNKVEQIQDKIRQQQDALGELRVNVHRSQRELQETATALNAVRDQREQVTQRDPRYLNLTTQLVELLEKEELCATAVKAVEEQERASFTQLTQLIVESHLLERTYADRMKTWSLMLSVAGTLLGFVSSAVMYRRRHKEIKQLITQTDSNIDKLSPKLADIKGALDDHSSKWSVLEEHVFKMFQQQTDAIARVLMEQKLNELLADDPESTRTEGRHGRGSVPAGELSPEYARQLSTAISQEVYYHMRGLVKEHLAKLETEFKELKAHIANDSEDPSASLERTQTPPTRAVKAPPQSTQVLPPAATGQGTIVPVLESAGGRFSFPAGSGFDHTTAAVTLGTVCLLAAAAAQLFLGSYF